jgi:hypothetical protein
VDIAVDVPPNAAHVEGRYLLAPSVSPISLRVLPRSCTTIANLRIERDSSALSMLESRDGPWITYRDTIATRGDPLRLVVRYDVRPAGAGVIPLVQLASAVTSAGSTRTDPVKVAVKGSRRSGPGLLSHMTRQAPNDSAAYLVAVPSFVEVAGPRATPCEEGAGGRGSDGGLVWRLVVLAGIMAAWVRLYLTWARRSEQGEHT